MKTSSSRPWLLFGALAILLGLAGCVTQPQATALTQELPFDQAVLQATDGLVQQTQKLPAFLTRVESKLVKRGVVLDPMLDASSGQQTNATVLLQNRVVQRMTTQHEQLQVLPFKAANLSQAQYLLTGSMTRQPAADRKRQVFVINLALTDLKSGTVLAQASARARDEGIDATPLRYYLDSPVLVKDAVVEGYLRTTATPPGQRGDATYLERITTATLINDATELYNAERYQEALGQYRSALATPSGEQLRVLNGIYLSAWKLGRMQEAEQAFGRVVSLGIAYNQLGVKFLFNPGSTDFWSDTKVSGAYGMWLRQIAKEGVSARVCMDVVGHTSRTGGEEVNDALSLRRAAYVKQRLESESGQLVSRTRAVGKGFRENIVGSGSDNTADALDRRVEFKITPCPG